MTSWTGDKRQPFRKAISQSFCILFLSYFSKNQIKRFGVRSKHAQAFKYCTYCPICYSRCVCPAWASLLYRRYGINLEGASPLWAGVTP